MREFLVKGEDRKSSLSNLLQKIKQYCNGKQFNYVIKPEANDKYSGKWRAYARIELGD